MADAATTEQPVSPAEIRALISDLTAEVQTLRAQVADQGRMIPRFQPTGNNPDRAGIFTGMERGRPFDREGDHARMVIGTDGHPLSNGELQRDPPAFAPGDVVRLNLEATPRGAERTWGEIVEDVNAKQKARRKKQVSLFGRVRYINYKRGDGEYKYRVSFPGLSSLNPDKDRGMGFDQSDLLAVS